MVRAHRVLHGGRVEQLCYVTTAAMAWLLTGGIDRVPPFSGVWRERGTGPSDADRAIAYGYSDDEGFDEDHTLIALTRGGHTVLVDSCLAEGRALTLRVVEAVPPPPPGQSARYVAL